MVQIHSYQTVFSERDRAEEVLGVCMAALGLSNSQFPFFGRSFISTYLVSYVPRGAFLVHHDWTFTYGGPWWLGVCAPIEFASRAGGEHQ
jgi:hypothetical protein